MKNSELSKAAWRLGSVALSVRNPLLMIKMRSSQNKPTLPIGQILPFQELLDSAANRPVEPTSILLAVQTPVS